MIEVEQRTYDGAPHFHENGSAFFVDELQYVGEPSRAIDHAWALLTWGKYYGPYQFSQFGHFSVGKF